jgi:hypothetical protein
MDKGWVLKVTEVGARVRLGTSTYQDVTEPNHPINSNCQRPRPLQPVDERRKGVRRLLALKAAEN